MKTKHRIMLAAFSALFVFFGTMLAAHLFSLDGWIRATGRVTGVRQDGGFRFEYEIDGKEYDKTMKHTDDPFANPGEAGFYYNSSNPDDIRFGVERESAVLLFGIVISACCIVLTDLAIMRDERARRTLSQASVSEADKNDEPLVALMDDAHELERNGKRDDDDDSDDIKSTRNGLVIRSYKKRDAGWLKGLFDSVGYELDTSSEILERAMENASHVLVACRDEEVVGLVRSMDDGVWSANIDCIVVRKDFQRQGVGAWLVRELLDELKYIKRVNVDSNEHADISFYKRLGFELKSDGRLLQFERRDESIDDGE